MGIRVCSFLFVVGTLATGALASFQASLDLIVKHHGKDEISLAHTLDTLSHITAKLKDEPEDEKYRSIRLLNKTFWERVGSVNGGISFMSALGFDLVEQGEPQVVSCYEYDRRFYMHVCTSTSTRYTTVLL